MYHCVCLLEFSESFGRTASCALSPKDTLLRGKIAKVLCLRFGGTESSRSLKERCM